MHLEGDIISLLIILLTVGDAKMTEGMKIKSTCKLFLDMIEHAERRLFGS